MRRIAVIILLGFVVLLTAVAGLGWYLAGDEAFLKSQLKRISFEQTGRSLEVDGGLRLDLGRVTTIEAEGIRFSNAPWAGEAEMVRLGRLLLAVDLPSLWRDGPPVLPRLEIENCQVSLARNESGEANWELTAAGVEPAPPDEPATRSGPPVLLPDLTLRQCVLALTSPQRPEPLVAEFDAVDLQLLAGGRVQGEIDARLNGEELQADGWLQPLAAFELGGRLDHELDLQLGAVRLHSQGTVAETRDWSGVNLQGYLRGPEFAKLLEPFAIPPFSEGAFDFSVGLNSEGASTLIEVDGDLGSVDARIRGELDRLVSPTTGALDLSVAGADLRALGQAFRIEGLMSEPYRLDAQAVLSDSVVHLDTARLQVGPDRLTAAGSLGKLQGPLAPDLSLDFQTKDLRSWAMLAGWSNLRSASLSLQGHVTFREQELGLQDVHVTLDDHSVTADGLLNLAGDHAGSRLDLQLDVRDVARLGSTFGVQDLPSQPLQLAVKLKPEGKGLDFSVGDGNMGNIQLYASGRIADLGKPLGVDAEFRVSLPSLTGLGFLLPDRKLPDQPFAVRGHLVNETDQSRIDEVRIELGSLVAALEGTIGHDQSFDARFKLRAPDASLLQGLVGQSLPAAPLDMQGQVTFRAPELQLQDLHLTLDDHSVVADGLLNLSGDHAGSRLDLQLDVKDMARLGGAFGVRDLPSEPLQLALKLMPEGKGLTFDIGDGNLGSIKLDARGRIANLAKPLGVDAEFQVHLPSVTALGFLLPERNLPDQPFRAHGRLVNESDQTRVEKVEAELGSLRLSLDGVLGHAGNFDMRAAATGPDISMLDELLGRALPQQSFAVASQLTGTRSGFDLTRLEVRLGDSVIRGDLQVGLADITRVHGRLASEYLDLRGWLGGGEEQVDVPAEARSARQYRFDDTPVIAATDIGMDLDLQIEVARLELENTDLQDVRAAVALNPKSLSLKPFSLRGSDGGAFNGELAVDATERVPRLDLKLHGNNLRLGLAAAEGQDPATFPPIELDLALSGQGHTQRELASRLNGRLRWYAGSGLVASAGIELLFSDFLTELFNTLNPFAESSEYTRLDCGVMAADIESGQVALSPVIFQTKQLTILSEGAIDLSTEKLDLSFATKPREGLGLSAGALINPLIKVGGRLASPAIELDPKGTVVSGGLALATVGLSVLAKSMSDRFLSSKDPCGDARREIEQRDAAGAVKSTEQG